MERLYTKDNPLRSTLEQYLDTCLNISTQYVAGSTLGYASDIVLGELQAIASYKAMLERSENYLRKFRNRCHNIVPINSLPPELLTHIFCLAYKGECLLRRERSSSSPCDDHSNSPMSLLYVCSHWNSVARSSHALWSHIDIAPFSSHNKTLIDRGTLLASRSRGLEIHVNMNGPVSSSYCKPELLEFCAAIATRAKSLHLSDVHELGGGQLAVVGKLLANCVPGTLTRLTLQTHTRSDFQGFIATHDSRIPGGFGLLEVSASHHHLEEVLRHVTTLHLDSIWPCWTSQAYSGLEKLRLVDMISIGISASELAGVLNASPQLRVLHFDFSIKEDGVVPPPVRLNNLQVLHLRLEDLEAHETMLRLINPGPKPLQVSIRFSYFEAQSLTRGEHKRFLMCSNVTQLYVVSMEGSEPLELPELLKITPNLRTLSLDGVNLAQPQDVPLISEDENACLGSQFTELHLSDYDINLEMFRHITRTYPITKLTVDPESCLVDGGGQVAGRLKKKCMAELTEICPLIEFVEWEDPTHEEWN